MNFGIEHLKKIYENFKNTVDLGLGQKFTMIKKLDTAPK